eukprot:8299694-Alexandrium_andersonii.AAC.1
MHVAHLAAGHCAAPAALGGSAGAAHVGAGGPAQRAALRILGGVLRGQLHLGRPQGLAGWVGRLATCAGVGLARARGVGRVAVLALARLGR